MLRIVIYTLFVLIFCTEHAYSFDFDMTVDDEIRKNYNSTKLVHDEKIDELEQLPALPENLEYDNANYVLKKDFTKKISPNSVKIPKGTSIAVVNTGKISDWQKKGTVVKFKTTSPVYKKKYTIPASTIFVGEVIDSHQPQISCNGGLVVIRIKSMSYKGENYPLNAYITRADDKIIFLNNIKGERTYLKTVWTKGSWGRAMFDRMMSLTVSLGKDGSTFLLSPFPFLYGTLCLGGNTLISPVSAFFNKGKHVSINAGSRFKIKLLEDTYIE